jgi:hypothetical protein
MNDEESPATPSSHLGFRIAVGVVGLILLAVLVLLGSVALKQSATTQALETRESLRQSSESAPAGD